jgi:hypothetical protein
MILLGKNSQDEYKLLEGTPSEGNEKFPGYDWFDSFESMREAATARNALILGIPVAAYELLRGCSNDKESLGMVINTIAESSNPTDELDFL